MPLDAVKIRRLIGDRSIAAVARASGMAPGNLSRLLLDPDRHRVIRLDTIERIAKALDVHARELIR